MANEIKALITGPAKPSELIRSSAVAEKFIKNYQLIHRVPRPIAESFYQAQQFHFLRILEENQKVAACSKMSLYGIFLEAAAYGLSFDPSAKHVYLVPYGNKATMMISGQGELTIRKMQGQILYADNPRIVYAEDYFDVSETNGATNITYKAVDGPKKEMKAAFLKITRIDGTIDYKVMWFSELMQLRNFSRDQNSLAWTKGLKGMFEAKLIKHAFKTYPKASITGSFSKLQSEEDDPTPVEIDYGIDIDEVEAEPIPEQPAPAIQQPAPQINNSWQQPAQAQQQPASNWNPAQQPEQYGNSFGPEPAKPNTVIIESDTF